MLATSKMGLEQGGQTGLVDALDGGQVHNDFSRRCLKCDANPLFEVLHGGADQAAGEQEAECELQRLTFLGGALRSTSVRGCYYVLRSSEDRVPSARSD
jgi:hypothetical protein